MKKFLIRFGFLGIVTYLFLFVYFYKSSGKFRQSVISAFVALVVFFLSQQPAHSAGQTDAFTQQNQPQKTRPQKQGIFSGKSNNDGPGPGKPNGNDSDGDDDGSGIPEYPQTESVQQTKERLQCMQEQVVKLQEETDSESEIETETECQSTYKVYNEMSPTLSKVSKIVRKDEETRKSLDKLEEQLENGEFHAGRGTKKLPGTKSIYYLRAGNKGRLFFRYSTNEKGAVEKLGESNKAKEQQVIDNLKQNYE